MQKFSINDYKKMPWKNGQGVTYEIFRDKGENLDDFGYRISMADVASDGAFSHFLGRERILTILTGDGIVLNIDKQQKITLQPQQVFSFSGDSDVYSTLINGAIRDLNVIFDPNLFTAHLTWLNGDDSLTTQADTVFIVANSDNTQCLMNNEIIALGQFGSVKIPNTKTMKIHLKEGMMIVVEISAC